MCFGVYLLVVVLIVTVVAQPSLMGTAKVIQLAQLLDKDPAKPSRVTAAVPLLVLISAYCILGDF